MARRDNALTVLPAAARVRRRADALDKTDAVLVAVVEDIVLEIRFAGRPEGDDGGIRDMFPADCRRADWPERASLMMDDDGIDSGWRWRH
jgi:hypothetical protein